MSWWGLIVLLLAGCATPQQRAEHQAWQTICRYAPHQPGEMPQEEIRAMDVAQAWSLSVAEVDARCTAQP